MTAIGIGALVFAALVVSFAAGPVRAQEATVRIDNLAFAPAATTVRAGTKVLLVNRDDSPHLVVLANAAPRLWIGTTALLSSSTCRVNLFIFAACTRR
jgi:plastocyanin